MAAPITLSTFAASEFQMGFETVFASQLINQKSAYVVPPGIYRGFRLEPTASPLQVSVVADPTYGDHLAQYVTGPASGTPGAAITIRRTTSSFNIDMTPFSAGGPNTVVVTLQANYQTGFTSTVNIQGYLLADYLASSLGPSGSNELLVLGVVTVPATSIVISTITPLYRSSSWLNEPGEAVGWVPVLRNPGFEWGNVGKSYANAAPCWQLSQGVSTTYNWQPSTAQANTGNQSLALMAASSWTSGAIAASAYQYVNVPVLQTPSGTPAPWGQLIRFSIAIKQVQTTIGGATIDAFAEFVTSAGTTIVSPPGPGLGTTFVNIQAATTDSVWRVVTNTFAVPNTAVALRRLGIIAAFTPTTGNSAIAYFDDFQCWVETDSPSLTGIAQSKQATYTSAAPLVISDPTSASTNVFNDVGALVTFGNNATSGHTEGLVTVQQLNTAPSVAITAPNVNPTILQTGKTILQDDLVVTVPAASAETAITATGDGAGVGVVGTGGSSGQGVVGNSSSSAAAVEGVNASTGAGIYGNANGGSGSGSGVSGQTASTSSSVAGVKGLATAAGGVGVLALSTNAGGGTGIIATVTGNGDGVITTAGGTGAGVYATGGPSGGSGLDGFGGGSGPGVSGTGGTSGPGVIGTAGTGSGQPGVEGSGDGSGAGMSGTGGGTSGIGLLGTGGTPNGVGVEGQGVGTGVGVVGLGAGASYSPPSGSGGVFGASATTTAGVTGTNSGGGAGVRGVVTLGNGPAVRGEASGAFNASVPNGQTGVFGSGSSTGPGVQGVNNGTGPGVLGDQTIAAGTGPGVEGIGNTGDGGVFTSTTSGNGVTAQGGLGDTHGGDGGPGIVATGGAFGEPGSNGGPGGVFTGVVGFVGGNGGAGITAQGGDAGGGLGTSAGPGVQGTGGAGGAGVSGISNGTGPALAGSSNGSGPALSVSSSSTGEGVLVTTTNGVGIDVTSGGNHQAVLVHTNGTFAAVDITQAGAGAGVLINTSGASATGTALAVTSSAYAASMVPAVGITSTATGNNSAVIATSAGTAAVLSLSNSSTGAAIVATGGSGADACTVTVPGTHDFNAVAGNTGGATSSGVQGTNTGAGYGVYGVSATGIGVYAAPPTGAGYAFVLGDQSAGTLGAAVQGCLVNWVSGTFPHTGHTLINLGGSTVNTPGLWIYTGPGGSNPGWIQILAY